MRHHSVVGLMTVALALSGYGCSDSPTAPSQSAVPSAQAAAPAPTVTSVKISGNAALTAIGQTSQLTATAAYSDGTTKDVTTTAQWVSQTPSIITVSASGVVTAAGLGVANIQAGFQSKQGFLLVTATPPDTFAIFGRVREPGNSGIPAVRVLETPSGQSTLSDREGGYSFGGLTTAHLTFEKEGFETGQLDAVPSKFNDMALQRIVRVSAGDSLTGLELAPHDMSYTAGTDRCFPCKLVRVIAPAAGTLHLSLTWTEPRAILNLWANGNRVVGSSSNVTSDVPVSAGEVVVYVGWNLPPPQDGAPVYVKFNLATAMGVTP